MESQRRYAVPSTTRSRVVLEVASELAGAPGWPYPQALVSMREQGGPEWRVKLFGSDTVAAIDEIAKRQVDVAIINPASPLTLAVRGTGPFKQPIPLRAIGVIPSEDQLAFAVSARTGLTSLEDVARQKYPLRVSVRAQPDHSVHFVIRHVLGTAGFSLDDIVAWGGEVRYDPGLPDRFGGQIPGSKDAVSYQPGRKDDPTRLGMVASGAVDAIFDEAVNTWANYALDLKMRFLPLGEDLIRRVEEVGFRRAPITQKDYPNLPADVMSVDFSGWPIFTHAEASDEFVTAFCTALDARKDRIPWQGEGPLPLALMCRDTPGAPLDIPLHPAAERVWRELGYLS